MSTQKPALDWAKWHAGYDQDGSLRRRLEVVQRHITDFLTTFEASPVRVISMCAGEGRDLLGVLDDSQRRDVTGVLVELDPVLASRARDHVAALGLERLEVVTSDAGTSAVYRPYAPADLVLACGVFGNISDADVEATLRALPMLCAPNATVIWTRHRGAPDITPRIREWLAESGFVNTAYDPVPESDTLGTVGVARFASQTAAFEERHLFTFNRTTL